MASNNYATPESDVGNYKADVIQSSMWSAKGRLSVLSYLGQSFVLMIAAMVLLGLAVAAGVFLFGGGTDFENPENMSPMAFVLAIPVFLVVMWIGICMMIKRLHDRNMSGWWGLLMLVPFVSLIFMIILFIPSQGKGQPNRFGAWRTTRTWEKVLGILYLLVTVGSIVLAVAGGVMAGQAQLCVD